MPPSPKSQNIESYADALELQLSNLNARLAATLDTLDEITRNHEVELVGLHDQARYLRAKCQVSKSKAKEAEAERDELKADVNKLVEKDPIPSQPIIRLEEDIHRDAYFPAILNSLNAELKAEKYAFSELQRVSEARIATLEAQVARREAELYAYKPCSCRFSATSEPSTPGAHKAKVQPAKTTLSKAQHTLIEEEMAMRQRTLEVELDGLRWKLQSAQAEAFRPNLPLLAPKGLPESSAKPRNSPSSRLTTHPVQSGPTPHPVLSDIDLQLARIGKEADNLRAERDNVKAEVDTGRADDDDRYPDDLKDENFRGVLLIEEECLRLRESERSLRQELVLATAAASATEHSLKTLVNKLQRQLHMLRNPDTSGSSAHESNMDPDDEFLNDVASEHTITTHVEAPVLTPPLRISPQHLQLSPDALLSGITDDDHDFHPSPSSDRPPSAPPFFFHPTRVQQRHSGTRLAQIESELNQARSDVREKDQAITVLRAQLSGLQKAVQARTFREEGGRWHGSDDERNG